MEQDHDEFVKMSNPYQIWCAGNQILPELASTYVSVTTMVHASRGAVDEAFAKGWSGTGGLPTMYAAWDLLRTTFQDALAKTAENLVETGVALTEFAEDLSATDAQGAAEIEQAQAELAETGAPPVIVGKPHYSSDGERLNDEKSGG